jgi:hypothetical protein
MTLPMGRVVSSRCTQLILVVWHVTWRFGRNPFYNKMFLTHQSIGCPIIIKCRSDRQTLLHTSKSLKIKRAGYYTCKCPFCKWLLPFKTVCHTWWQSMPYILITVDAIQYILITVDAIQYILITVDAIQNSWCHFYSSTVISYMYGINYFK